MTPLVDSHSHVDVDAFDADRAQALARARAAGVVAQIVPAIERAGFENLRAVCREHAGLYAAYGLHPMYLPAHEPAHLDDVADWVMRERPVAIGECGLDFYVEGLDRDLQQTYFERQVALARDTGLPLIVHARRAVDQVIATVRRHAGSRADAVRGVVHSFSGSAEQAQQLWKLGFLLGIGGPITYARAHRLREIVATMPIEHLLLETDSPDQPLSGHQGQRNEPARLPDVLHAIAALRDADADAIGAATTANACGLFGIDVNAAATSTPA